MSDEEYFEQLCSNSIDGTLTDAEREKLEAHLAECPSCAALKQDLERMQALFAEEVEPPAGLHENIIQRLEQESKLKVVQPEKPVRHMPVITMVAAAAVVVLVVLGGGLMPMFFSTVGSGSTTATADASAASGAAAGSADMDSAVQEAAEQAGVENEAAAEAETDGSAAPADSASGGAAQPELYTAGQEEDQVPADEGTAAAEETQQERMDASTLAPSEETGGDTNQSTADPGIAAVQSNAQPVEIPETMRAMTVAHCYLAQGGGELPDIGGELLGTDGDTSWFLLENNLSTIQDTLGAVEDAGYTVSAYEGTGITIDSKAASWMLIVTAD